MLQLATLTLTYNAVMEKQKAIKLAGSQVKLAAILGVSQAAISQWGEDVPMMRIYQLKTLKPEWFVNEPTKVPPPVVETT